MNNNRQLPGIANIYIINHKDLVDRMQFQIQQFERLGLEFTRIESTRVFDKTNFFNANVKSLYCTTIKTLERCAKYKQPCLILEDDAVILDICQLENFLKITINSEETKDWDFIYFFPPLNDTKITKINDHVNRVDSILCAHAYIINPKIIDQIIQKLKDNLIYVEANKPADLFETIIDHFYVKHIHPHYNVYAPPDHIVSQHRKKFGSTLGYIGDKARSKGIKDVNISQ